MSRLLKAVFLLSLGPVALSSTSPGRLTAEGLAGEGGTEGAEFLLARAPVKLSLQDLYSTARQGGDEFGESYTLGYHPPRLRFDFLFGAMVNFDNSGMAFGRATSDENFDAGGGFGFRLQAEVAWNFYIGGEIDFTFHDVDIGEVFFPGYFSRMYFMLPMTYEWRMGTHPMAPSLDFTVAPGVQIVFPSVDHDFQDFQAFMGRFIEQDEFAGFTLRAALTFRVPTNEFSHFFFETSYDWAYGRADVEVLDGFGLVIEQRSADVDLSSLQLMLGWTLLF